MRGYVYCLLLLILVAIYVAICYTHRPRGTIFTVTTFFDFDKQDRWDTFCKGMDTLQAIHSPEELAQIDKWLVVNEWSDAPKADWARRMRKRYPHIEFIQKTKGEKGQARSLNMILERIRPYEYWIQWEESWYAAQPFLGRSLTVMRTTNIDQLQVTKLNGVVDWSDAHQTQCGPDYCIVGDEWSPYLATNPYDISPTQPIEFWPSYSLRPSVNRTGIYQRVGQFSEDPKLWPGRFEWEYGVRWLCNRGVKGILPDGPVTRSDRHVSTYH
jgi:hypothetical protein